MAEEKWWTCPLEDDEGHLIMVTGRSDVEKFRNNPRFTIRVEINLPYTATADGMPDNSSAEMLEKVLEALKDELRKDPVAVLTGVYTGAGVRTMVFYTLSTTIFNKKLNAALADMPLLPLEITAENDPEWFEFQEMEDAGKIEDEE